MSGAHPVRGGRGDRRALVTGGAGFVGGRLVRRLIDEGWAVLVVDDLSSGSIESVPATIRVERLDISVDDLETPIHAWRPSVVFHLAAQTSVPRSMEDPLRDLAVNVIGTYRLGAAAHAAGAGLLVFASSGGAIYGSSIRSAGEARRPDPASYYGIHKLAAEGYAALSGLPSLVVRPSNIYGPGQRSGVEGAVVASFVDQALRDGTLRIHGDGSQTRDLIHVDDAVAAILHLTRAGALGIWNISSGRSVSVAHLASTIERALGRPLARSYGPMRPGDVHRSAISAAKLRHSGWRPEIALDRGVSALIDRAVGSYSIRARSSRPDQADPEP